MKNDKEFYIVEPIGATIVHFTTDYNDLKFIVIGSGIEIAFSELKDFAAFFDSIKKREISFGEARPKQEEFNRYLRK